MDEFAGNNTTKISDLTISEFKEIIKQAIREERCFNHNVYTSPYNNSFYTEIDWPQFRPNIVCEDIQGDKING